MKNDLQLRKLIGFILEDLAKINPRAGRGYGVGATSTTNAKKEMLGPVRKKEPKQKDKKTPVKISRVFLNNEIF
jgi:hypothetical protein